ncbi:hypothetical protein GCM10009841_17660 [Microlunatus panaciterrae]|uniref:DUF559 domain-containing protein n=1 Tax=Microlunatus panaciterrae TaxID=400768 RepID=A0ABS2RMX0_9ACTN|nr:DUF559 domain-containing protein [Microlunatus panaciterrae]MBM7800325.1 hypothetical protein [Microlunatus panaciterrae]
MRRVPRQVPPFDTRSPFFRYEALAAGLTDVDLRGERFRRIFQGIYVNFSTPVDVRTRARAALRVMPSGSHISHCTAVELWGGVSPDSSQTHISVVSGSVRSVRQGIKSHLALPGAAIVALGGMPVASPTQAFLELATMGASLVDLVIAGDSLVKSANVGPEDFVSAAKQWRGRGARLARRAARLVRPGVDSPMETRLRLLVVFAGLPEPRINWIIRNDEGGWRLRFDLAYPELKLIIEYDGRQHADSDRQWLRDIGRREELDEMGWRIIVVTSQGIYSEPDATLKRIQKALVERGAVGVPRRLSSEWTRHFSQ